MAASIIMKAIGMGASASGAFMSNEAREAESRGQAKIARYNAEVLEQDALAAKQKSTFDQIMAVRAGERALGTIRAKAGASGAMVSEGAPLHVQAEQAWENELMSAIIGYEGQTAARKYRSQAAGYRTSAQYSDMRADQIKAGKWFEVLGAAFGGGGGSLLGMSSVGGGGSTGQMSSAGQSSWSMNSTGGSLGGNMRNFSGY